ILQLQRLHPPPPPGYVPGVSRLRRSVSRAFSNGSKPATPPSVSASLGGSPRGVGAEGVPREVAIIAVEDQAHNLGRLRNVQRFLEKLAGRPVSRDRDKKPVHASPDDPTIGEGHEGRGVEDDVVVLLTSLREELAEPGGLQHLVGGRRKAAR